MAVSQTTRLNIYRWSAGTDAFTRAQMDASHEELEDRVAGYSQAASRPAAALAYKGFFHYSTTGQLSYCNGTAWDDIAVENTTDGNIGEIDGTASAGTSASGLAYAEHKHSIAADAITSGNIVSLDAAKLTGTLNVDRIAAGTITDAKIDTVDASKLFGSLSLDTSGNAATATQLETARTIGGVSFNGSANIDLPGVNAPGTQDTSGNADTATDATNATNATKVTVTSENTSATRYIAFADGTSSNRNIKVDTNLTYNPSSNTLTAGTFSGALSGNVTGDVTGNLTGTASLATSVTVTANNSTNESTYVAFVDGSAGTQGVETDSTLRFNPSSNTLGSSSTNYTGFTVNVSEYVDAGWFVADAGTESLPAYSFAGDLDTGIYRSAADTMQLVAGGNGSAVITSGGFALDLGVDFSAWPATGTGNDAEWVATGFGNYILKRNSSLRAEKENIQDPGDELTADMIDQVEPKLWNRIHSPGIPEIGPIAEDMDAISPHLAAHGFNEDGTTFLTGINKTSYLSLLVLAVKDLRTRIAALEA
jgi:hypothetical protein